MKNGLNSGGTDPNRDDVTDWIIHEVLPERYELCAALIGDSDHPDLCSKLRALAGALRGGGSPRHPTRSFHYALDCPNALLLSITYDPDDFDINLSIDSHLSLNLIQHYALPLSPFEALYRKHILDAVARGLLNVPIVPAIDARILAAVEGKQAVGMLRMSTWHTCSTTHCRAGWAVHLAGEEGYALERKFGAGTAGTLIYVVSRPDKPIPDFYYADDEEALADLRMCAAEEVTDVER